MSNNPAQEHLKHAKTDLPIHELILQRWSPRAFTDEPVTDADLKTLFTAASWAASSSNEQPWRFIVGRKGDASYEKIFNSLAEGNQKWAYEAPILFVTVAKKTFTKGGAPNGSAQHDVGAASATLSLQATAMGMHTHGMGGYDKETVRAFFGIPTDFEPIACWALGYVGSPDSLPEN